MLQVMPSDTYDVCFGPSSCPEVLLFKLFRHKMEQKLNHHEPRPRATTLISTSGDLMSPIHNQLSKGHSHEDCKVLWHAEAGMHIRMNSKCNIRAPGDIHRTHWVAKTIYTLKMERLLEGNEALMQVTACEQQPLQPFNRFVAHVYIVTPRYACVNNYYECGTALIQQFNSATKYKIPKLQEHRQPL